MTNLAEPILKCPEQFPQIKKYVNFCVFLRCVRADQKKKSKEGERGILRSSQFSIGYFCPANVQSRSDLMLFCSKKKDTQFLNSPQDLTKFFLYIKSGLKFAIS